MQRLNPQTIPIASNASTQINIQNPSTTRFMQVWGYSIVASNTAANIGFFNGNLGGALGGVLGGYQSIALGSPLTHPITSLDPIFTVDPNTNLVVSNPNSAVLGGWVRISN